MNVGTHAPSTRCVSHPTWSACTCVCTHRVDRVRREAGVGEPLHERPLLVRPEREREVLEVADARVDEDGARADLDHERLHPQRDVAVGVGVVGQRPRGGAATAAAVAAGKKNSGGMWAISSSTTLVIVASPTRHCWVSVLIVALFYGPTVRGLAAPAGAPDAKPTDGRGTMPGRVPPADPRRSAGALVGRAARRGARAPAPVAAPDDAPRAPARTARPNILFVLTDDMTRADLHAMPGVERIDRRARDARSRGRWSACRCAARRARRSCAASTRTTPASRRTAAPTAASRRRTGSASSGRRSRPGCTRAGYRTGLIGKYLNGFPNTAPESYRPPGWTDWVTPVAGNPYNEYGYRLNVNGHFVDHGFTAGRLRHDRLPPPRPPVHRRARRARTARSSSTSRCTRPHRPATPGAARRRPVPRPAAAAPAVVRRVGHPRQAALAPDRAADDARRCERAVAGAVQPAAGVAAGGRPGRGRARATSCAARASCATPTSCSRPTTGSTTASTGCPAGKQTAFDEDVRVPLLVRGPGRAGGVDVGRARRQRRLRADVRPPGRRRVRRRSSTAARSPTGCTVEPPRVGPPRVPHRALARGRAPRRARRGSRSSRPTTTRPTRPARRRRAPGTRPPDGATGGRPRHTASRTSRTSPSTTASAPPPTPTWSTSTATASSTTCATTRTSSPTSTTAPTRATQIALGRRARRGRVVPRPAVPDRRRAARGRAALPAHGARR